MCNLENEIFMCTKEFITTMHLDFVRMKMISAPFLHCRKARNVILGNFEEGNKIYRIFECLKL